MDKHIAVGEKKQLRTAGLILSIVLLIAATVLVLTAGPTAYETDILANGGSLGATFDDTYTAELADPAYGEMSIRYEENLEDYMVHARFTKTGSTELILTAPDGTQQRFAIEIGRDTYEIIPITDP